MHPKIKINTISDSSLTLGLKSYFSKFKRIFSVLFLLQFVLSALLVYPRSVFAYSTNMDASIVVGQQNFTSGTANQGGSIGANTLSNTASSLAIVDSKGRFIASDTDNNRVLIWNTVPTANNQSADLVLGQADFTSGSVNRGGSATANTFSAPAGVFSDGNTLVVADRDNRRVLIWSSFPTTNGQSADVVIGQSSMTTVAAACSQSGFMRPQTVWIYNNKIIVTERSAGRRVLIFNSIPTTNGASADLVLGQSNFTTCSDGGTSQSSTQNPYGVSVDSSGKLFIGDEGASRVLIWNSFPTSNNQEADTVVCQSDFTSNSTGTAANRCSGMRYAYSNGSRLFVADRANNRVLIFNSIPASNGQSADIVLGQSDFTSGSQYGGGTINASNFLNSGGVFEKDNKLFVTSNDSRILIFNNLIKEPGLSLNNSPEGRDNNYVRLKGTSTVDNPYTVKNVEFSVNNGSFSGATATDGSFDEASEEYYFDFLPTSNQPKDNNGNLIDGYTVRIKATNNNTDVTDRLFYFSPFDLHSPSDNATVTTNYPSFEFSVNKQRENVRDNLSKYQVQVRKGGSDSTASWETLIDDIPIDFRSVKNNRDNKQWETYGHLDTNNGVYETDKLYATYSDESSRVKVYSKINSMSGTYQWKIIAVDKAGHTQEAGARNLYVNYRASSNNFPLAVLNISGLGNPFLNTYDLSSIKDTYYTSSANPIFYGIAWTNSKVALKLTDQGCKTDCTKTYSTTANAESRYGINIPKGDVSYGKKYTANLSIALEDKYNELPQFTLSIGGSSLPNDTLAETQEGEAAETKNDTEVAPSQSPEPSPTPTQTQETKTNKRCIWFICW